MTLTLTQTKHDHWKKCYVFTIQVLGPNRGIFLKPNMHPSVRFLSESYTWMHVWVFVQYGNGPNTWIVQKPKHQTNICLFEINSWVYLKIFLTQTIPWTKSYLRKIISAKIISKSRPYLEQNHTLNKIIFQTNPYIDQDHISLKIMSYTKPCINQNYISDKTIFQSRPWLRQNYVSIKTISWTKSYFNQDYISVKDLTQSRLYFWQNNILDKTKPYSKNSVFNKNTIFKQNVFIWKTPCVYTSHFVHPHIEQKLKPVPSTLGCLGQVWFEKYPPVWTNGLICTKTHISK